ncbi:unnamed protein product [Darwinula stevensoni]|uniref:F-box domain-containing protein n=1 Tax=Darwinula stevensoni TaxID=69355 RepID=A0A7R8X5X9_9CRUS|nr:unnamed protein product [Darwinula stevensoni]CAG0886391.1 unnamed protein product [Darwinula stevensoni]
MVLTRQATAATEGRAALTLTDLPYRSPRPSTSTAQVQEKLHILSLPPEILEHIIDFLPYQEVAHVRLAGELLQVDSG